MKKYLKYLIPLFSIFIFSNVYALADVNFVTPNKPTALQNCLNSGVCDENQFWEQMLTYNNMIVEDTSHNYYSIYYRISNNTIYYVRTNNPLFLKFYYNYGNSYVDLKFENDNIAWREINYTYNSNGIISGVNSYFDYTYSGSNSMVSLIGGGMTTDIIILATNQEGYEYKYYDSWQNYSFSIDSGPTYSYQDNVPIDFLNGTEFNWTPYDMFSGPTEPTYTYNETILENGNVRLDFTFTNYSEGSNYAFEIENGISNEEYGITNTFSNIFPNIIPYGNSYSIELGFDTYLYVTLSQYTQVEQTTLYTREEIYTQMIDINNIVFEDSSDPYFTIYRQYRGIIEGSFANIKNNNTCWYQVSTQQSETQVDCDQVFYIEYYTNGYVTISIKKGNNIVYTRNINIMGSYTPFPMIVWETTKQDFYSVINWSVERTTHYPNITYRYSTNGGTTFTEWESYNSNDTYKINAFDNSVVIIEIANSSQSQIYDQKSIQVVNNIDTIKNINGGTSSFLDKFKSLFKVNGKILENISAYYESVKYSKVYLLIFIPFLASIISGIIYLIRRK